MSKRKVIVFGIDGATWRILNPLMNDGILNHFNEVVSGGAYGILESTIPYVTLPAWTSMFTGVNPGKHGIIDYIVRVDNRFELCTPSIRGVDTIWHILSDIGEKITLLNDPISYPPEPIGIHVTGFLTPPSARNYVYPPEMKGELDRVSDRYVPEVRQEYYRVVKEDPEAAYNLLKEYAGKIFKAARFLLSNYEWDVAAIIFTSTDRLQHFYWRRTGYIRDHYLQLDSYLKEVMNIASGEEANLLIVSDHGFNGVKRFFYINSLLFERGYLMREEEAMISRGLRRLGVNRESFVKKFSKIPRLLRIVRKVTPKAIKRTIPPKLGEKISWERSLTFAATDAGLFINKPLLRYDYEVFRAEVIREILSMRVESGRLILAAYRREEVLWGPFINRAPDIFLVPEEGVKLRLELLPGTITASIDEFPGQAVRTGDHEIDGVFVLFGPGVKRGARLPRHKIWDVAPTILALRDIPVPDYFDGKPISDGFKELRARFAEQRPTALRNRLVKAAQSMKKRMKRT